MRKRIWRPALLALLGAHVLAVWSAPSYAQTLGGPVPTAELKLWNTQPILGNDPTESVDDPDGITEQGTGAPTIVTLYENTTHSGGPCGVSYWNPETNAFVWYGFSGGFQSGIDLNRSAPPKLHLASGRVLQPGDVWLAKSGGGSVTPFLVQFRGSNVFRHYLGLTSCWGVKVDKATGDVWVSEYDGNINLFDPATDAVQKWFVGGTPTFLAIDAAGRAYCTVAGLDQVVRVDPATNEVTRWGVPGGGFQAIGGHILPNGITVDAEGQVWFSETASDEIGRLDPATNSIIEYCCPSELDDPQLIESGGSAGDLQAFVAEGVGNAVSVVTELAASGCVETIVTPTVEIVTPSGSVLTYSDEPETPATATIEPEVFTVVGEACQPAAEAACADGTPVPGVLRFPFPPAFGDLAHAPAGIGGVTSPFTVRGGNIGSDSHFQLVTCAILACPDFDDDEVCDADDNCVSTPNPLQADDDDDGIGNICDNCPDDFNPDQADMDSDGLGDVCDPCPMMVECDCDLDGHLDPIDNCVCIFNPGQEDGDGDLQGDVCDNCPDVFNPEQGNSDGDEFGDLCDPCPEDPKNLCGGGECIEVRAGDPFFTGGLWLLPIETPDDLLDDSIFAFSIDYHVDPSVFGVIGYETSGSMTEFASSYIEFNELGPGHFRVAWANVAPLEGPGVFVYLVANLLEEAKCHECIDLVIGDVLLNEGIPCAEPVNGEFCVPGVPISGGVSYYACDALDDEPANPRPIPDAHMAIAIACSSGVSDDMILTDDDGHYLLSGCDGCENCITPSRPKDDTTPFVSPFDASLVLKTVAELYSPDLCAMAPVVYDQTGGGDLTVCPAPPGFEAGVEITGPNPEDFLIHPQRVAGDVSRNGVLTAFDAALILQFAVGDSMGLASHAGNWDFYCPDRCYWPVGSIVDSDFVGILGGDVSGDWNPDGIPLPSPSAAQIPLQVTTQSNGDEMQLFLSVGNVDGGFFSARFDLAYEGSQWEYLGAITTGATTKFLVADHAENGLLKVAVAGAEAAPDGEVLQLRFKGKGRKGSRLPRVVDALINDGSQPVSLGESSGSTGVNEFTDFVGIRLAVAPNPSRENVDLSIRLDGPGHVTLRIFGVDGRLVRTLVDRELHAPKMVVRWDGADGSGRRVATGTYFVHLQRGSDTTVERVVMLR